MNGAKSFIFNSLIHQRQRGGRNKSSRHSLTTQGPSICRRDRDPLYGSIFVKRAEGMGIKQKLISPKSPWLNPFIEQLVGSIRRECLDRVMMFNERQLK